MGVIDDPHVDQGDDAVFGGHSPRRSGAIFWISRGLEEDLLRRIARWKYRILEEHLQGYPLGQIGPWSVKAPTQHNTLHQPLVKVEMLMTEFKFNKEEATEVMDKTWKDTPENMQIKQTGNLRALFARSPSSLLASFAAV